MPTGKVTVYPRGSRIGIFEVILFRGMVPHGTRSRATYDVQCTSCGTVYENRRQDTIKHTSTACKACRDYSYPQPKANTDADLVAAQRLFNAHWKAVGDGKLRFPQ